MTFVEIKEPNKVIPVFSCIEMGFYHHQRGGNHTVKHTIKSPCSKDLPETGKHSINKQTYSYPKKSLI
jgi:hypothetical protein